MEPTTDAGGGLNVGWIDPDDSMTYNTPIPVSPVNSYRLSLRVANGTNTNSFFRIETQNGNFLGTFEVAPTGGWQNWVTLTAQGTSFEAIESVRIVNSQGQFNLNWFEIAPTLTEKFVVKDAIKNVFLPERKAHFEKFLDNCTQCGPEMVVNGGFDNSNAWQTYIDGSANATITLSGNAKNATANIQNGGSQSWHVQLKQAGLNLQQGKTYRLMFNAKSTTGNTFKLDTMLERNGGDFAKYLAPQTLIATPTEQSFSYTFTMDAASDANARITFNMGNNLCAVRGCNSRIQTGGVEIDSVSLKEILPATPSNMLVNGHFANGMNGWNTYINSAANAAFDFNSFQDARISSWNGGSQTWHVQLSQGNVNLQQGGVYELSFDTTTFGKTTTAHCDAVVEQNGGSYTAYSGVNTFHPNPGLQQLVYTFTMNNVSDPAARVTFNCGLNNQLGDGMASVFGIDNVVLKKLN